MTIILRVFADYTAMAELKSIYRMDLQQQLNLGDSIAIEQGCATVKERVYYPDSDCLEINAVMDGAYTPLEKEVD